MEATHVVGVSGGYFNLAYEKCKSIACAIRGYPTRNIFVVNTNCSKTPYAHRQQTEKKR